MVLLSLTISSCQRESRGIACQKINEHHGVGMEGMETLATWESNIGRVEEWEARMDH